MKRASTRDSAAPPLKIMMVASECAPFAKVGGLADVVPALSKALSSEGHAVRIVMPLYRFIDRDRWGIRFKQSACVHMGGGEEAWVGVHEGAWDGVPVWFVDYERFFGRPGIYDDGWEYGDNAFRFALLSKAALQISKDTGFIPDVMHAHDWPTALVPVFLKTWDRILSPLSNTGSVLTIHNIGYQGVYHASAFSYIGVGWEHFTSDRFEDHGKINLLKAGIAFADALTTVSPGHAQEILTPEGGMGLAPYLNARRDVLTGILNGVDYSVWNPATDPLIPARYSPQDLRGKRICKAALQRRLGLWEQPEIPLFGIVSRFAHQKGFGLLKEALPQALRERVFLVAVLGMGEPDTENFFRQLAAAWPGRVGCYIGFSNELSHWIEAGADFFLMPSLYEPCGLNQMYSMKYGTLPVVRATGGLNDTVENYDPATGSGTGFKFYDPTPAALLGTLRWVVDTWYRRPDHIRQLQAQAMRKDFSWENSAQQYLRVYEQAIARRRSS